MRPQTHENTTNMNIRKSGLTVLKTVEKVARIGWELLLYPHNSQDFAPSEFHLFGPLKQSLEGLKLNDNHDVQQHTF